MLRLVSVWSVSELSSQDRVLIVAIYLDNTNHLLDNTFHIGMS